MTVTVLGAGAWGTALATLVHENGHPVVLWDRDRSHLERMAGDRQNDRYLPGIALPAEWRLEPDLGTAVHAGELIVLALPSQALRSVARHLGPGPATLVSATKGIELDSGLTMSGVLAACCPGRPLGVVSGPSFALEVARGIPTAVVAASTDPGTAALLRDTLHRPTFRVYTSRDVLGVELGGALKNVIAIAAGVSDGLGFGDNSKAALVTRGLAEMRRLGVACGALPDTFAGLSGLGDLTVTCFSHLSRNRRFGERLGRGERSADVLASTRSVAEGHATTRAARELARARGVETPIIDEVHAMLYEGKDVGQALRDLLTRDARAES